MLSPLSNRACHPGGHCWDYYRDTISLSQATATHLKIGHLHIYIPRIRRIGGCYGFTSKPPAARRPPPAARNGINAITKKTTGWIVLKFGIHIGSDSVLTWLTFQGRKSKVKVTASENGVIFSTFFNFHFLSHFPPKPSWGGHSNTPQQ